MDTLQAIQKRRSIRNFTGEPIPVEDLEKLVDAARLAPTGYNKQPWDFILITNKAIIQLLSKSADWSVNAAAMIAIVMDPASDYWLEDGSAAIENILLAATAMGYGSCWVQGSIEPHRPEFKLLLNIPESLNLLALVPVGVPAEWPESKDKKPLKAVIHWETY